MQNNHRIGWLGTGRMGSAMATRLINAGTDMTVWNRTAAKAAPLLELGATQAHTIADLTACDIVFTTATSSADLLAVATGPDGLLTGERVAPIVVDCSTVSAEAAAQVRDVARARGSEFLSAPISGNPAMVIEGGAAIVASGAAVVFDHVQPYLRMMAPTVVYCGGGEESRLVKLCHNLMLGIITEALAEATTLADKGGVAPSAFLEFINGSVLSSTFIRHKGNAIRTRNSKPPSPPKTCVRTSIWASRLRARWRCRCRWRPPPIN